MTASDPHSLRGFGGLVRALARAVRHRNDYRRIWSEAARELDNENWPQVASLMEQLSELGADTRRSHHWKGSAYCKLGEWSRALQCYEQIERPFREPGTESRRIVNYATSLLHSSRPDEAEAVLAAAQTTGWSADMVRTRDKLLLFAKGFERPNPEPAAGDDAE